MVDTEDKHEPPKPPPIDSVDSGAAAEAPAVVVPGKLMPLASPVTPETPEPATPEMDLLASPTPPESNSAATPETPTSPVTPETPEPVAPETIVPLASEATPESTATVAVEMPGPLASPPSKPVKPRRPAIPPVNVWDSKWAEKYSSYITSLTTVEELISFSMGLMEEEINLPFLKAVDEMLEKRGMELNIPTPSPRLTQTIEEAQRLSRLNKP